MPKGRRKGATRKGRTSRAGNQTGVLPSLTTAYRDLLDQRDEIDRQIAALEHAITTMQGSASNGTVVGISGARRSRPVARRQSRRGPGRPRGSTAKGYRKGSVKALIVDTLSARGKAMRVPEVAKAILAAGYKTKNQTFAKSVGIAMTEMPEVKRVARGVYKLK